MDVVYSDPKDSKLYQTPGTDPPRPLQVTSAAPPPQPSNDVLCKMYVTGRESQYCRPYVTMRSFQPPGKIFNLKKKIRENQKIQIFT